MENLKKAILLIAIAALTAALTACSGGQGNSSEAASGDSASEEAAGANGETTAGPHLDIVGAFYGDLGSDESYQSLCIVFDYVNDDTNRTMPTTGDGITIKINDSNVYTAEDNDIQEYTSRASGTYTFRNFDFTERYTGYRYPVGYGDVLGGSDPIRMLVATLFNPNDFKNGDTITLTIGDVSGEFPVSEATEITLADEIMKVEPDFETAQILAAEIWRLDCAALVVKNLARDLAIGGGDEFSGYSQSMKTLFSPESGGVSVFEDSSGGFFQETHTFNTIVDSLPAYDHDVIVKSYPEAADLIESFEKQWDVLSDSILDPGTDSETYAEQIAGILDTYHEICDTLAIGTVRNL